MLEIARLVLMLAILAVASYHDIRTRTIPDYVWVIGGGAGAILYIFDWGEVNSFVLFTIFVGIAIAVAVWRFFPMGDADALAILVVSIVYPVSFNSIMNPAVAFFGGVIMEHIAAIFYNLRYNIEDVYRRTLFCNIENSLRVKVMAFYSVHRKRPHEKFTFCAEKNIDENTRAITLKTPHPESEYETRTDVFVMWAMPALPFMMAATVLGIIVARILL